MSAWSRVPYRRRAVIRAYFAGRLPLPCSVCGRPVERGTPWDIDHRQAIDTHPDLILEPANWWPAHRGCNRALGARPKEITPWRTTW